MVTIFEVAKLQDVYERIDRTNSASDKKVIALCETFRKKADISINQAIRIARREINLSQILSICKITQGNLDQAYVCADEFSYTFGIRRETACAAIQDINERLAEANVPTIKGRIPRDYYKKYILSCLEESLQVEDVARLLRVSRSRAIAIVQKINAEMRNKGYRTIPGQVNRKYFEDKLRQNNIPVGASEPDCARTEITTLSDDNNFKIIFTCSPWTREKHTVVVEEISI